MPAVIIPVVTSVAMTPADGDLTIGANLVLKVSTSSAVSIIGGTPTLTLNDGGTAVYDAASSTPTTLIFRNTVQVGENTPDLAVTAVLLNGAAVTDGNGRTVSLDDAVGNPDGTLQIDTIRPTAISFVMSSSFDPGDLYTMTVTFSEPIIRSGGTPSFVFANGAVVFLDSRLSTPTTAVFSYTIQPGDSPASLAIVDFNQNNNITADSAGNILDDTSVGEQIAAAVGNFSDVTDGQVTPTTVDMYRFYDAKNATYFYTQSQAEYTAILNTRPDLVPESANDVGLTAVNPAGNDPNAAPVFRFFDLTKGTQFLTASTAERDGIIASRQDLVYEPSSTFYEHTTAQAGDTAVYRYFNAASGTHSYTDSPSERATIMQTRPDLVAEGISFYEPLRNPST